MISKDLSTTKSQYTSSQFNDSQYNFNLISISGMYEVVDDRQVLMTRG